LICCHADVSTNYFISVYNSSQNPLFFLHANVRSLNKNMDKLENLLHLLSTSSHIIAVTETKLKSNNFVSSNIPGYRFIYINSHTNSGGVGMYVQQGIFSTVRNDINLNNSLVADIWIDAKLNGSNSSTIVSVIYFHSHSSHQTFQDELESQSESLNLSNKKVFMMGDFNIKLLQKSQPVVNYLKSLTCLGFISLIDCPKRFMMNQTPSLLDHIYTNQHDKKIILARLLSPLVIIIPLML